MLASFEQLPLETRHTKVFTPCPKFVTNENGSVESEIDVPAGELIHLPVAPINIGLFPLKVVVVPQIDCGVPEASTILLTIITSLKSEQIP